MSYIKKTIYEMEMDSIERSICENLIVSNLDNHNFQVYNADKNTEYDVSIVDGIYTCTCPHHQYRHVNCKHIMKVINYYN